MIFNIILYSVTCNVNFHSIKIKYKLKMVYYTITVLRTIKAIVTHATIIETTLSSRLLNTICVPVIPNKTGSKTIQNISKAVAAGF